MFGEAQAETAGEVFERWDEIKKAERKGDDQDASALARFEGRFRALRAPIVPGTPERSRA